MISCCTAEDNMNSDAVSPVLTDILCATIFPPMTAMAVHTACPKVPPNETPKGFWTKEKVNHS